MKILHVSYRMDIGGAERSLYQLVRAQKAAGLNPTIAVLSKHGYYGERVAELGVPVVDLHQRNAFDFAAAQRFRELAADQDYVHFQTQSPALLWTLGRTRSTPIAYTHRGGQLDVHPKRRLMHCVWGRLIGKYADVISGNTQHALHCARRDYGLKQTAGFVTYNGVDFSLLQPARNKQQVLRELGEASDASYWRIGTSANLRDLKRTDLLLRSVARMRHTHSRCYILGDGPARRELETLAESLGIQDRVLFLGRKTNVADYLQILDAFALLSGQAESFGNSAVEALGLGIPTAVMADGGGMVEHFPGQCRRRPTNLDELAALLDSWIENPQEAHRFATICRQYVVGKYTIEKMVASYTALYNEAAVVFRRKAMKTGAVPTSSPAGDSFSRNSIPMSANSPARD